MSTKSQHRKSQIKRGLLVVSFLVLVAVGLLLLDRWDSKRNKQPTEQLPESADVLEYNGESYVANENIETVLFVGLDSFSENAEHYGTDELRADFVMLLIMDKKAEKAKLLQLSRDTIVDVNLLDVTGFKVTGTKKMQLALAHTEGNGGLTSLINTADSVTALLGGVKINKMVSVKMDAVPILNDMADGVTLTVLHDFGDVDASLVKDKSVTLTGEQALTYVRSRQGVGDGSNEQRMERQRQYMDALYGSLKTKSENDSGFIIQALIQISDYLVSDCVNAELEELYNTVIEYDIGEIQTLKGTTKLGERFMEFYPDEDALKQLVVENFYRKAS